MRSNIERTIESYNQTATEYAQKTAKLFPEGIEKLLTYLKPNSYVLDLGCGFGRDAETFLKNGHRVVGVDLSGNLLDIARKNVPNAEFKLMDLTRLEFEADIFDGICSVASLLHVPKCYMASTLQGCHRVLVDGGFMYVSVKRGDGEEMKSDERYGGVQKFWSFFQQDEIEKLLRDNDFEIVETSSETVKKDNSYATNPWIDIICKK